MAKNASINISITGDETGAVRAFKRAATQASAFGGIISGIAMKGISALANKIASYSSAVMSMSDAQNKFKSTMSFAGLDTSAIDKATKSARAYADATVYDLSTVQNTMAQLASNGVGDYDNLTKAAGNLNAVAGGNADTFNSVAMVLTQTAGAGKLTTENWNQLANAIPGASGKLQDAMLKNGAYTGNFRDAMAKGEITADEFNKAIMDLGMSDVAKEAATSTSTMEGALGNLEAAITGGLTDAFDQIKPAVTGGLGAASDMITNLASVGVPAIAGIVSKVQDFSNAFADTGALQSFGDAMGSAWEAIQHVGDAVGTIFGVLTPLPAVMSDASGAGDTMGNAFKTVADLVSGAADALTSLSDWVAANAEPISTALVSIGTGFAMFKIAGVISTVVSALQGFSLATTAASIAQAGLNLVMNANPIMLIVSAIAALVAGLIYFFTQTQLGQQIWSAFTSFIGGAVQSIIGFFRSLPGQISNFFNGAVNGAKSKFNDLVSFVRGIPGAILGALGGVSNLLYNAGSSIINGFLNGIKNAFEGVKNFVGGIAGWIAEHKGPLSYDARLLIPAGNAIMGGFAQGLTRGFNSQVTRAISNVNSKMYNLQLNSPTMLLTGTGQAQPMNVTINITGELIDDRTVGKLERMLKERAWERGR